MFNYPLRQKRPATRTKNTQYEMRQERRKPILPGPYIYVGDWVAVDDPGNDPPVTTWQSPPWLNGWTWLDTSYVGFRHGLDGETEFTGVLDTSGATSGTVAFRLPQPWWPIKEFSFITDLDLGGGTFSAARVLIRGQSATPGTQGNVIVYFPIT